MNLRMSFYCTGNRHAGNTWTEVAMRSCRLRYISDWYPSYCPDAESIRVISWT